MFVELELTTPLDIESRDLTNRKILAKYCPWNYRGSGCDYRGAPVQREDGKPFTFGKDVFKGTEDVSNTELKQPWASNRRKASSRDRSFLNMENFGEEFIFSNANDLYDSQKDYNPGHVVYIVNDRIRIQDVRNPNVFRSSLTYFVCRKYAKPGRDPRDNPEYWDKDGCGKKLNQCKSRFAKTSIQKVFLETDFYEQQMWNLQGYEEGVHQGYLKLKNNYNDVAEITKSRFRYKQDGWGSYSNTPPVFALVDLFKEFTLLVDIESLDRPQRYDFYPQGVEEEDRQEDVDQIIFKTSKETVGYGTSHSQFVLGLQKEPYMEFNSFSAIKVSGVYPETNQRIKLVGINADDDYFRVKNRNGLPILPEGGYDVKNSKNFVLSLRKDKYPPPGTTQSQARFRANWSCVTYPNDEEKESVFIEAQSSVFLDRMLTDDTDRFVFFGGTTNMPVNDISGLNITDISKFTDEPTTYEEKWSQQPMQVASVGIWGKALTNGQLNSLKTQQNTVLEGATYAVEIVKRWEDIVEEEKGRVGNEVLADCYHFWQEPFEQDGDFYVTDHHNGNHLIYKDRNTAFGGGDSSGPFTKDGYDLVDLQYRVGRAPNVGKETLIEGEFGTLPFGGFPGTDGYRFSS